MIAESALQWSFIGLGIGLGAFLVLFIFGAAFWYSNPENVERAYRK